MNKTTLIILLILSPLIVFGVYVLGNIVFGTLTDYSPDELEDVQIEGSANKAADSTFSLFIWNIGYSGLGAKSNFFYDGGEMVVSPKPLYDEYLEGIKKVITDHSDHDFLLLQEVDINSKRSYGVNQHEAFQQILNTHQSGFAYNYKVKFLPIPFTNPMGKVNGGLASYSKYPVKQATRHQFPGNYSWPKRIYFLDRCFLTFRIDLPNGKELLVINTHNSAYDDGGLKAQQMAYMKDFLLAEYEQGNYVVVGGDWNQCPPNHDGAKFYPEANKDMPVCRNISEDYLPADWQWVYNDKVPTNRELATLYDKENTNTKVIDFYLVSPNVGVLQASGVNLDFKYSDHQPVLMNITLK